MWKKVIIIGLLGLTDVSILILISIFDANNTTGVIWGWIVFSIIVIVIMCKIIPPKDLMEYGRLQTKQLKAKRDKEVKYIKLPYNNFKGVARTYTRNRITYLILFIIFFASVAVFFLFSPYRDIETILIIAGSFLLLLYQIFLLFFETVTITPEYISCRHWLKNYTIQWSEIKTIGITVDRYGRAESCIGYIYVSREIIKDEISTISKSDINDNFIFMAYGIQVVQHIMAYYHGEIKNLSMVNSWIRYVRKNQ